MRGLRRTGRRSRTRGGSPVRSLAVVIATLALLAATIPSGSITLADIPRNAGTDVVTDGNGVVGLSIADRAAIGTTDWLVNTTNHYDRSLSVTIELDPAAASVGDLYVGGTNEGDTATFSLASGGSRTVDIAIPQDCSLGGRSIPFDVHATNTGFNATAERTSQVSSTLGLRDNVVYQQQGDNTLAEIQRDGSVVDHGFTTKGFGPADADFDCDGEVEIPYVDGDSGISIVDANGEVQTLVSSGVANDVVLGVGDFDGDGSPAVVYPNGNHGNRLYRVEYGGTPTQIGSGSAASSVAGVADFNSDGDQDIVYTKNNKRIHYLDDGTEVDTGVQASCTMCIGAPADFDGDGTKRVPFTTKGQGAIALADDQGNTEQVWNGGDSPMGSLGSFDWNDDGTPDVVMAYNADKKLYWIDYASGSQNGPIQDAGGVDVQGDSYGVA